MTGFGSAEVPLPAGRIIAEVRSVNGRTLDVRVKLPEALSELALWAEQLVRAHVQRGRVEASLRLEGAAAVPIEIDRVRAESALAELRELCRRSSIDAEVPLSLLASVPGVFVPKAEAMDALRGAAKEALELALKSLDGARDREGEATLRDLLTHADALGEAQARVKERSLTLPEAFKERLSARLARLDVVVDEARLATEVALLAERTDVSEELSRLSAHLAHFATVVDIAGRPAQKSGESARRAGRELDFLLQEMMREVGTLGAKAQDLEVSQHVVRMKVALERMREQVQNVE